MPALPYGVSINLTPLDDDHDPCFANALDQARNWHEVTTDGQYYRDTLEFPRTTGTQTGLPEQLTSGRWARTYCPIRRPGVWHCIWEGQAEVLIVNGNSRGSGSTYLLPGRTGEFTFTADATDRYAQITIALVNPADPIRNFRVVHSTDATGSAWLGFAAGFRARMHALRPEWLRFLGWYKVNNGTGEFPTLWSHRRPDTFWTQSDTALDVFTVSGTSWSGAAPLLGQTIEYLNGASVVANGVCVRVGGSDPGVLAHVKVANFFGQVSDSTSARVVATGSTATITTAAGPWSPMVRGPSFESLMKLLVEFPFLVGLWINTPMVVCPDWHAGFATAWLADARTAGKKIAAERVNEVWNTPYPFARANAYVNAQGTADGVPGPNPWERGPQWNLWKAHTVEWPEWESRFSTASRSDDFLRVVCWQNANGNTYWYDYATILNPYNEVNAAGITRLVVPIDILGTAPYFANLEGWTASQMQSATTTDLNNELQASITTYCDTPGSSLQFWMAAASARTALQGGRTCNYFSYEVGQHSVPNWLIGWGSLSQQDRDAITAKMITFQESSSMTLGYQRVLGILRAANHPACWFDDAQTWSSFGFWGHTRTPYNPDGSPNITDPRFNVLLRQQVAVHQRNGDDCDVRFIASPGTWQRVDRASIGANWTVTVTVAAGAGALISTTTHLREGKDWSVDVATAAGEGIRIPGVDPIIYEGIGAETSIRSLLDAGDGKLELSVIHVRTGQEHETVVCMAPGTWAPFEPGIFNRAGAEWAIAMTVDGSGALVPIAGTLTGPRRAHAHTTIGPGRRYRKPIGVVIHRGALLTWSMHPIADPDGDLVNIVVPLRLDELFAGVAIDRATADEEYVEVSLRGTLFADVAGLMAGDADVILVATNDQQVSTQIDSAGNAVAGVVIGRGYYDPAQLPQIAYEAVEARSVDFTPQPSSGPPQVPPVAPV